MATPPVDRLAVRTFIMPFDPIVIREAILREKMRGGQVFYVCPRVSDIRSIIDQLNNMVPEVKVSIAHGQMNVKDLEITMEEFCHGDYDVLVSTTIIESGLDIPRANTIIIHRSDMFGLSQLYQLRGRIGRGSDRAHAYLLMPENQRINKDAMQRLSILMD